MKRKEYSFSKMIIHPKYENEIIFRYYRPEIKLSLLNPYTVANLILMQRSNQFGGRIGLEWGQVGVRGKVSFHDLESISQIYHDHF